MNDNDPLKQLFDDFRPDISPADSFMARLESRLDTVEILKQQDASRRRHSRTAMAIAFAVGFVSGVLLTLAFPFVDGLMALSLDPLFEGLALGFSPSATITALLFCVATLLLAFNAYDLSFSLLTRPRRCQPK